MPLIMLTRGKVAIVDDEDFDQLSKFKWHAHRNAATGVYRAVRHVSGTRNKTVDMTREILGEREGFVVDHKNRDTLDNRRSNLRWASRAENAVNWLRRNKHGARGVFQNGPNTFTARISINKVRITVGSFSNVDDAREAYIAAAQKYHRDFATTEVA
jgi:hypothetical protein